MNTLTSEVLLACGKMLRVTCHMHSCPLGNTKCQEWVFLSRWEVIIELLYLSQQDSWRAHCLTL